MNTLVSKDEPLRTCLAHVGYLVLMELQKQADRRLSLGELSLKLRSHKIDEYRPIMFALIFLHSTGSIEFKAPYLHLTNEA